MANDDYDSYIVTRDSGKTKNFEPRALQNNREWVRQSGHAHIIYVHVQTSRGGSEYRPLARFSRLPPLDTIPLYSSNSPNSSLAPGDPRVLEAVRAQRQPAAVTTACARVDPAPAREKPITDFPSPKAARRARDQVLAAASHEAAPSERLQRVKLVLEIVVAVVTLCGGIIALILSFKR